MTDALLVLVSALLLAIAAVGLVAHVIDAQRQWMLVAAALSPYLMAGAVPAAALSAAATQWYLCAASVVATGVAVGTQWPLYRARWTPGHDSPAGRRLTLMQANILVGAADPAALVSAVDRAGVDVLTVCELTPAGLDRIRASGLSSLLPHCYYSTGECGDGTGIWSRYPLSDTTRHDGFVTELLSARVQLPNGPAPLVFAVHPVPPWPRKPADWLRELELLRQLLAKVPADAGPVLVAGDFNATFDHRRFRNLLDGSYRDAASSIGAGMLATYAADRWYPPIIAIDHILLREAVAHEVRTVELPGSDHRGIVADVTV